MILNKVNIYDKKILFLGFGAVAKCVLAYFHEYLIYDVKKIFIVDKCSNEINMKYLFNIPKKNIFIEKIDNNNFDFLLEKINMKSQDIVIDLTYFSHTYYFVEKCLLLGLNYINTSIEDTNDHLMGTSIDFQQKTILHIYNKFLKKHKVKSNILIEFGQNPGLIQHYILFALNKLNQILKNTNIDDYNKETLINTICKYKIGTIFISEIDEIIKNKDKNKKNINCNGKKLLNTWSVAGFLGESFENTELVVGKNNKFIKPKIEKKYIDNEKTNLLEIKNQGYKVTILKQNGENSYLNTIGPLIKNNHLKWIEFDGRLIHHGEIFDLAKLFGEYTPFMSYVYKINKYAELSFKNYIKKESIKEDIQKIKLLICNNCEEYEVFNNIDKPNQEKCIGEDSIGCTIFCGENKVEKAYWCGTILNALDKNVHPLFTPTIIQVAAGILSGLSFIMETQNKNLGLLYSSNLDTNYILEKSVPLLGHFSFQEIPENHYKNFSFDFKIK